MPLPPTYLASHHHIFSRINDRCLASHHHVLAVYPSETTPLQSANLQLAFNYDFDSTAEQLCHSNYNDTTPTTVTTNPHHHPSDNCFEYFFLMTIFLSVWIPSSFHSTIAIFSNTEFPFIFVMAQLLSTNQINPNKYISNKSFPTNPFSTISEIYILSSASLSSFSPVSS